MIVVVKVCTLVRLNITLVRLNITLVSLNNTLSAFNDGNGKMIKLKSLESAVCILPPAYSPQYAVHSLYFTLTGIIKFL